LGGLSGIPFSTAGPAGHGRRVPQPVRQLGRPRFDPVGQLAKASIFRSREIGNGDGGSRT
jgi:hypothetical protein